MESLIEYFVIDAPRISLSLDTVIMYLGFVMILSSMELIACCLGKVREK